jgi:hypothetical protein
MICPFSYSLRCAPRPCSFGTRSMTSIARSKRSTSFWIASSNGVLMFPYFFVAAHMDVGVVPSAIRELVDQPRISMEVEDHGFVFGKQGIEVAIGEPVRMFSRRLQGIQIDHVDEADLQIRQALTRMVTAPSVSCVKISPALATTTSASPPSSLLSWAGL